MDALVGSGVSRVVLGMPHPLPRLRGYAIAALQTAGIAVHVMSLENATADNPELSSAWLAVLRVNEALLHRVALGRPFSVWKYAMTLDGKIASSTGHSAWVTGAAEVERLGSSMYGSMALSLRYLRFASQVQLRENESTVSALAQTRWSSGVKLCATTTPD